MHLNSLQHCVTQNLYSHLIAPTGGAFPQCSFHFLVHVIIFFTLGSSFSPFLSFLKDSSTLLPKHKTAVPRVCDVRERTTNFWSLRIRAKLSRQALRRGARRPLAQETGQVGDEREDGRRLHTLARSHHQVAKNWVRVICRCVWYVSEQTGPTLVRWSSMKPRRMTSMSCCGYHFKMLRS